MKRIVVQKQITVFKATFLTLCTIAIMALLYFLFSNSILTFMSNFQYNSMFIGITLMFSIVWYSCAYSEEKYVSELQLTDDDFVIVYKSGNKIFEQKIERSNIESVYVEFYATATYLLRIYHDFNTTVTIKTKFNETITFSVNSESSINCQLPNYDFVVEFISLASELNNFTYSINGNLISATEDVKSFIESNKRLPFTIILIMIFGQLPLYYKLVFCMCILGVVALIFLYLDFLQLFSITGIAIIILGLISLLAIIDLYRNYK